MTWPALLNHRTFPLVLVTLWALAYLPHLGVRDARLEEGRRATCAREMLASGDFVRPTLYGETYLRKPPLFFWLVAATGAVFGEVTPLAARLPSVLAALGCALVALRFAPDVLDRRTRALAALFVLSSATLLDKGTLGEIDTTLSLVVVLALKVWWDGNRPSGQTFRSWLWVGLLLGLAGLIKGPSGPAVFYLTVGPYLVWRRRWDRLFTHGHALCVLLTVTPAAVWVGMLLERGVIGTADLAEIWAHQLGAKDSAQTLADPGSRAAHLLDHYTQFLPLVLGMFFPGVLWLGYALNPRWSAARDVPEDLRRLLLCGVLGPVIAFYLYAEARPRHMMPAFFPAAVLGAIVVNGMTRAITAPARSRVSTLLAFAPLIAGTAGLSLALVVCPVELPTATAALVVCVAWTCVAVRITRRTDDADRPISLAVNVAGLMLAGWFVANVVVFPWRAPTAPTRVALATVPGRLSDDEIVYTTRTFPWHSEGYYNLQFHLARDVRGTDVAGLKRLAPCAVVVTPAERAGLEAEGWVVEEIGRLAARGGPPEVHLIRLRSQGERSGVSRPIVTGSGD